MNEYITKEQVRASGGIVHSDGNIFFTNIDQLNAAVQAWIDANQMAQAVALAKSGEQERNFCERCGKRSVKGHVHTCTPPMESHTESIKQAAQAYGAECAVNGTGEGVKVAWRNFLSTMGDGR